MRPTSTDRHGNVRSSEGISLRTTSQGPEIPDPGIPDRVDQKELFEFVQKNFRKRECRRYVRSESKSSDNISVCYCGHEESHHTRSDAIEAPPSTRPWNADNDTVESVTDAFGEISFGGRTTSKYIRVDKNTNASQLFELLSEYWNLETPTLLISMTGGTQNFKMNAKLKEVFRRGLVKAAESTGAWITTAGYQSGVMKQVGEAIRDHTMKCGSKNMITAIGIATWGCVSNKEALTNPQGYGLWPANYPSADVILKDECPLEPNHSHFILVDDGTQHCFGVELALRANLERKISTTKTSSDNNSVSIPIVCPVLEGGASTIQTVKTAIDNGISCIIVEGSGGAADIFAYAYNNSTEEDIDVTDYFGKTQTRVVAIYEDGLRDELSEKIEAEFGTTNLKQNVDLVMSCIEKRDHLTVFRADGKGTESDIDITILKALLKTNRGNQIDQLKLALAWNRADLAKDEIYTDNAVFEPNDLYELFYTALVTNKVEFVKLFLSKGVSLKEFLSCQRLLKLYNDPITLDRCRPFKKAITAGQLISLRDVGEFVKHLIGNYYVPMYCTTPYCNVDPRDYLSDRKRPSRGSKTANPASAGLENIPAISAVAQVAVGKTAAKKKGKPTIVFEDPARDIFLWCILLHMKEMSVIFWDAGKEDIAASLTAQHIIKSLRETEYDSDLIAELEAQEQFYEQISVGVLNECYKADQRRTTLLLVRKIPSFGNTTVLKMAEQAEDIEFIAHPACQSLLTHIWTGDLSDDNSYVLIILSLFLPFLAPFLMKYREKEKKQNLTTDTSNKKRTKITSKPVANGQLKTNIIPDQKKRVRPGIRDDDDEDDDDDDEDRRPNCLVQYWSRLIEFLMCPFTTFCYNCMSYFAFLVLYGVILLTDFYPIHIKAIDAKEIVLIVWIGTFIFEEIRQILEDDGLNLKMKLREYITDLWNFLDVLTIVSYIAGLILRFIPPTECERCFYAGRIILALNLIGFFFRILHIFSVHQELGPKLVMIGNMCVDLFYFVIILLVFIAAFGVTSQVILYPNQPLDINLAVEVMKNAWWNVYGQLPELDEIAGKSCEEESSLLSAYECAAYGVKGEMVCTGKEKQCPANTWIVPILLAVYVLITNVMMLNLLIAMFSDTFNKIQGQTTVVWKMQRYELIREYESRPILPPPLIAFGHLYRLVYLLCCKRCCVKDETKFGFRMKLGQAEERDLIDWENIYAEQYIRQVELDEDAKMESQVREASDRAESIVVKFEQFTDNNFLSQEMPVAGSLNAKLPSILEERFYYIEEQLKRNAKALDWLVSQLRGESETELKLPDVDESRDKEKRKKYEQFSKKKRVATAHLKKIVSYHKKARSAIYPADLVDRLVTRVQVPDDKVPLDVEFVGYNPSIFTDGRVPSVEPELMQNPRPELPFNEFDQERNFERTSCLGTYPVQDRIPINPKGRTGLKGRGVLPRWGPNPMIKVLLTRWEPNSGTGVRHLQFLSVLPPSHNQQGFIPESICPASNNTPVYQCLERYVDNLYDPPVEAWFARRGKVIFGKDYFDDPRNTDNSWLEATAFNYHDEDGRTSTLFKFSSSNECRWERVHLNLDCFGADLKMLYNAAKFHHAAI